MNIVDAIIILVLIVLTLEGLGKSFIGVTINLLSFGLSFVLALLLYNHISLLLQQSLRLPHSLANVIGFIAIWVIVEVIFFVILSLYEHKFIHLTQLDKTLQPFSIIPAFFRGILLIIIVLILVGIFPIQPAIKQSVDKSVLGTFLIQHSTQLEIPLKAVFGGVAQDTLTFFTVKPETEQSVQLGFKTTNFSPNEQLESEMIVLVNQERTIRGLTPLAYNETLQQIARAHSEDMFTRGYFSHYTPEGKNVADRADNAHYSYIVIGENLAFAPTLEMAHQGLMNSPGHRANILSPDYNQIGVGIMESTEYGLMITQVFSN